MSRHSDGPGVSNRWSCSTLGDGLVHVKGNMDDSEEAALLQELEELICRSVDISVFFEHGQRTLIQDP